MEGSKFISIEESINGPQPPGPANPPTPDPNPTSPASPPANPPATPPADPPKDPPADPTPAADFNTAFLNDMKINGKEFTLPENFSTMSPQEQYDFFKQNVTSGVTSSTDDPFVQSYNKAKEQGLNSEEFIRQQMLAETVKAMPSRDFLIQSLIQENGKTEENPNGWTREDVESYVDNMNPIDRDTKANERKNQLYQNIDLENEKHQAKLSENIRVEAEKANATTVKQTVDALFAKKASATDIGGIPHTPQEQEAFKQIFTDAVEINPETGYSRTRELFSDDEVLYDTLFIYHKLKQSEGGLKNFLSNFKEEYKQELLDKTRLAPRKQDGSLHTVAVPKPEDFA